MSKKVLNYSLFRTVRDRNLKFYMFIIFKTEIFVRNSFYKIQNLKGRHINKRSNIEIFIILLKLET